MKKTNGRWLVVVLLFVATTISASMNENTNIEKRGCLISP